MKKNTSLIIIATLVLLLIITLLKPANLLAGGESYYHLMAAQPDKNTGLTVDGRQAVLSQYDYLLGFAFLFFEPVVFMKIFPILLGAFCVALVYLISKKFINENSSLYTSIIFLLSPAFLYIFATNSAEIVPLALLLTGFFLAISRSRISYFCIIPFIFACLSSAFVAILSIIILTTLFIIKRRRFDFLIGILIISIAGLIEKPFFIINYNLSSLPLISELFSDFGGLLGVSIFTAIFFVTGLIVTSKRRYFYPVLLFMIISFFIEPRTLIYSNVIICGFGGVGLNAIIEKRWQLKNLKYTMNFLLIAGILFSAVSHISIIKELPPDPEFVEAAEWLNYNSEPEAAVFSAPSNSFFIEYFSERKVLIDPLSYHSSNFDDFKNITEKIYYSRNLELTEKLLNKYGIKYILIDPDMTDGEIWKRPKEGFLFLMTNQQVFPIAYNRGGIKIAYYLE